MYMATPVLILCRWANPEYVTAALRMAWHVEMGQSSMLSKDLVVVLVFSCSAL